MKNIILLTVLMLTAVVSYPDSKISRGPNVDEIYFIGPTYTGLGLYRSTDFGQTAICVDSTLTTSIMSICADKTEGVVYYVTMQESLYISYDYGNINTWNITSGGIKIFLNSGRNEGEIYSSISKKSTDYGQNFYYNSCNGWFGNTIDSEIDNLGNNGYSCVYSSYEPDTIYLLYSNDDFENLQIQYTFLNNLLSDIEMTRGYYNGETYISLNQFNFHTTWLLRSTDFGQLFDTIDGYNFNNYYQFDIVGGRQEGEIYLIYNFVNQLWLNAHIYIFYSTNYGKSFEVYHPFSKGSEPVLANFSTIEKEVHITTPVEFSNFSIGDIQEFQWDFNNDGTVDAYEETPTWYYQDTGWYSVKLSAFGIDSTNAFIKQDYIHIIDTTTRVQENLAEDFQITPNPFNNIVTISSLIQSEEYSIYILNLRGEMVFETNKYNCKSFTINISDLTSGVYILNIVNHDKSSNFKIIKK